MRQAVRRSFSITADSTTANRMLDSRKAATAAMGAWVMAQMMIQ
jgi:hypothetical protein